MADALNTSELVYMDYLTRATFDLMDIKYTNHLYFIVDTGEIYKGSICFTDALIRCRKFPANPIGGKIYYNTTTRELKYFDVANNEWVSLLTPMVESLTEEDVDYGAVTVTGKAIKDYLDKRVDEMYESLGKQAGYNTVPIFNNYETAIKYAETSPLARAGQCITAPAQSGNGERVMYVIQPDKTLKEYPSMEQIKELLSWKPE